MAVRNILGSLNKRVDFHETILLSTYFGTTNVTLCLSRTNNFVLIQIQPFNISPTVTGELISDSELTE